MTDEITPERAREAALDLCRDYIDFMDAQRGDTTPRGISEAMKCEREKPNVLDDAELLWNLADLGGILDSDLSDLGIIQ